jgi:hypothetical protein
LEDREMRGRGRGRERRRRAEEVDIQGGLEEGWLVVVSLFPQDAST